MKNNLVKKGEITVVVNPIEPVKGVEEMSKKFFDKIDNIINPKKKTKKTFGDKTADSLAKWAGSWTFIISFFILLFGWMILNTTMILFGIWDIYPFILLNLVLSCMAAIQAPIILMSQNRQTKQDRIKTAFDYRVNKKAEEEIRMIQTQLNRIEEKLK